MKTTYVRSAGAILGLILMSGCGFLQPGPGSAERQQALGVKTATNPFTGDRRGEGSTETAAAPSNDDASRERAARGEATLRDMNVRLSQNRSQSTRPREGEHWFGATTDGGYFLSHIERDTENDFGALEYELDDDGQVVLDDRNEPVVANERPELIVARTLSTEYPFPAEELVVWDIQGGREMLDPVTGRRLQFTKLDMPGSDRDEAGFLGNNVCWALIVPQWLSDRFHSRAEGDEENAPARSHLIHLQIYSPTATEHFGDEQMGWLPIFPEIFGADSECYGMSTNPALEWRPRCKGCSRAARSEGRHDGTHVLMLAPANPDRENITKLVHSDIQH